VTDALYRFVMWRTDRNQLAALRNPVEAEDAR
jgi:hypothetical protein